MTAKCKTCGHEKERHNVHRNTCWNIGKNGYDCECEKFEADDDLREDPMLVKLANEWWKELKDWQKQFIFMEKDK